VFVSSSMFLVVFWLTPTRSPSPCVFVMSVLIPIFPLLVSSVRCLGDLPLLRRSPTRFLALHFPSRLRYRILYLLFSMVSVIGPPRFHVSFLLSSCVLFTVGLYYLHVLLLAVSFCGPLSYLWYVGMLY
jgi:hypothetical protein